jgi:hypothetical protein
MFDPLPPRFARIRARPGLCALLVLAPVFALAQSSGGPYTMRKQVIAGGGVTASGGAYRLVGTVSEPLVAAATGGSFRLQGGFHAPAARPDALLCDGFEDAPCP